jgi:thioredoxin-related protein
MHFWFRIAIFIAGLLPVYSFAMPSVNDTSSGKTVLYIFEGSDWCTNCHRLEKQVLQDSVFIRALQSNDIQIERIDFPQQKKQTREQEEYNNSIAEKYGFNGIFPTLVLSREDKEIYKLIYYHNESGEEFSKIVLTELKALQ